SHGKSLTRIFFRLQDNVGYPTHLLIRASRTEELERAIGKLAIKAEVLSTSWDLLAFHQTLQIRRFESEIRNRMGQDKRLDMSPLSKLMQNSFFSQIVPVEVESFSKTLADPKSRVGSVALRTLSSDPAHKSLIQSPQLLKIFESIISKRRQSSSFLFKHGDSVHLALTWALPERAGAYLLFLGDPRSFYDSSRTRVFLFSGLTITLLLTLLVYLLNQRNIEVSQLVEEKTEHLRIESEKAKEAAYVKTRFLANVSHEIRTPLNIMMGMVDLLNETSLSRRQTEFLQNMNSASGHLVRLIDDILDMARVDAQDVKFKYESVDFLKFIEDIVQFVQPGCEAKGLQFRVHLDPSLPSHLQTDPSRLKQVFVNLLNNALKFTEKGRIDLEVRMISNRGPLTPQSARLEFRVRDTGIGIPRSKQDDIFKAFYQVNPSTTRPTGGVGLGLAIVSGIVTRLNGVIQLESDLGKGSEFRVELPIPIETSSSWIQKFSSSEFRSEKMIIVEEDSVAPELSLQAWAEGFGFRAIALSWRREDLQRVDQVLSGCDVLVLVPPPFRYRTSKF
ncbi:MAG: sensor histidine kinase, partial [Bdellovibrionales bacterium]